MRPEPPAGPMMTLGNMRGLGVHQPSKISDPNLKTIGAHLIEY